MLNNNFYSFKPHLSPQISALELLCSPTNIDKKGKIWLLHFLFTKTCSLHRLNERTSLVFRSCVHMKKKHSLGTQKMMKFIVEFYTADQLIAVISADITSHMPQHEKMTTLTE